ncbi:MAG: NAD(P)/FAD-dependent oxidoreductase, partial [Proteobacteria bacterium]|nr:NAD(P)/FAD-dependent oxidoreductase [Pseudomonadota bacterium]
DCTDKKVVVIGSGATAVTIVPAIADDAEHVTMLQRSPTWMVARPDVDPVAKKIKRYLPRQFAHPIIRAKNTFFQQFFYKKTRTDPETVKGKLLQGVRALVGPDVDVDKHFTPSYNPWDQRMCLVPDSDLFNSIKSGKASVVTDHIDHFTENGILVKSGEHLEADIIVTATGIELNALNDIEVSVNNEKVEPHNRLSYKGMMLSGVPNLAFSFGYVNASWTLRADLTCEYVCRLLNRMDKLGVNTCIPQEDPTAIVDDEYIDFSSGYVQRALDKLPKQGKKAPWRNYQNYLKDIFLVRIFSIKDSTLKFYNSK